jgi:hypothetical protein
MKGHERSRNTNGEQSWRQFSQREDHVGRSVLYEVSVSDA